MSTNNTPTKSITGDIKESLNYASGWTKEFLGALFEEVLGDDIKNYKQMFNNLFAVGLFEKNGNYDVILRKFLGSLFEGDNIPTNNIQNIVRNIKKDNTQELNDFKKAFASEYENDVQNNPELAKLEQNKNSKSNYQNLPSDENAQSSFTISDADNRKKPTIGIASGPNGLGI